uniref:Uncharacterized protein n=1 Tax=Sinocyclocheilus rhinocerous TaxID=307959 RepID=A0A673K9B3_9TELE
SLSKDVPIKRDSECVREVMSRCSLRARLAQSLSGQVRASHTGRVPAVRSDSSALRPFSEIPGQWKNSVANLYTFWKIDGLRNIHRIMLHNFNMYGPIYR